MNEDEEGVTTNDTPDPRFTDGGAFIFDIPDTIPAVWGTGQEVVWAEGEALMIVGPSGVGKTTLTGQLVRALLGLSPEVLGYPVQRVQGKVLYLAMDRPRQIGRSLHRHFHPTERDVVSERLVIWEGPPPADLAKNPQLLKNMCLTAGASVVIVDSLKDAAIGLSDDAVGAGYNSARQLALAAGVEVLELHHQVKRGANGTKPNTLADVYGSTWITGGSGSVVLLWGEAGDPIVDLLHLKQPAEPIGPLKVSHDHHAGRSTVWEQADAETIVAAARGGVTARDYAEQMFDTDKPDPSQIERARRKLNSLVKAGRIDFREIPAADGANPSKVYVPRGSTQGSTHLFGRGPSTAA
ncbi:hypothetical protein GCM10027403_12940 [Arthrobacter tecti]